MDDFISVDTYLTGPEDLRRRELVWGVVREPAAPRFGHQSVVTRTTVILDTHVRAAELGMVCVAPIDVVLDEANALVVQPDVLFISQARAAIVREQIWGAPDLVVEVASRATARRDRTTRIGWYRQYGVRECWLVEPSSRTITIVNLRDDKADAQRFAGNAHIRSSVLPALVTEAEEFFR